jgi:5-methyltetrahydropteroyltriglutamate--homocysteine methyltransferase
MPRPQEVVDLLFAEDNDELTAVQRSQYNDVMQRNVTAVVQKQRDAGVDIPSDGEMSKISYATYIRHRLTGFSLGEVPRATPKDLDEFPEFRDRLAKAGGTPKYHRPICTGDITVKDHSALEKDITNLQEALQVNGLSEGFMNAASPGVIAVFQPNQHYKSNEDYLQALAEAMKVEYDKIAASGLVLQIDCPDLAMGRHIRFRDADDDEFLRNAQLQVEALNYALSDISAEQVRMHLCWGNYEGPHTHDVPLEKVIDIVLRAKPTAVQFEAANPRHAHEWQVWAEANIPDDKVLIPGVLDTTTNFVEHPQLIAERIQRFANIVGRERVIAGTDCGFGTFAGFGAIHPSICWAKLGAMAEGTRIASERLWA